MGKSICSIDECDRVVHGRKLCLKHYRRWQRHGSSDTVLNSRHEGDVQQRFWAKVDKTDTCWNWTAAVNSGGYGNYCVNGKNMNAHRCAFEMATGKTVPADLHVDHQCHNRLCVNPDHLRLATPIQNKENYDPEQVSSIHGVSWSKQYEKWRARVQHNGKCVYDKRFHRLDDAVAAVIEQRNRFHSFNDADRISR